MNVATLKQNMGILVKNVDKNIKADNSSTRKHRNEELNMSAVLIIKYYYTVMHCKRKLCECLTRCFFLFIVLWNHLSDAK